jgi:hypothetical protein
VIVGPSTEKILLDCARELMEGVLPHVVEDTAQVRVVMLEHVLRNAAMRAAHEIAWMQDETAELLTYAHAVHAALPHVTVLADALAIADRPSESLHLDDVVECYRKASEALSCAIEAAMNADDAALVKQGADLITSRLERERVVMCGWGELAGR